MKNNLTTFAENIYNYRKKLGKSQAQFADYISKEMNKSGITFDYSNKSISKWESADSAPSIEVSIALSKMMGVSLDELFKDKIENFKEPVHVLSNNEIVAKLRAFPDVTGILFGDKEVSLNYGIVGQMARSIIDYYDEEYIKDEDYAGSIVISCPYAVVDYDNDGVRNLEYLNDPINSKIVKSDFYVVDKAIRKFTLRLSKVFGEKEYSFKSCNLLHKISLLSELRDEEEKAQDNYIVPDFVLKDLEVDSLEKIATDFATTFKEVEDKTKKYEESGLVDGIVINFGFDSENKKIIFYLCGTLKLTLEELDEVWKSISINEFHYMLTNIIGKRSAKEFLEPIWSRKWTICFLMSNA